MISENIELMKVVIQGKREIPQKSCVFILPYRLNIPYIAYGVILDDAVKVIEMERAIKTVGLDDGSK